jgi:non-specific serine/threonine protein kinase
MPSLRRIVPSLSPRGRLTLVEDDSAPPVEGEVADRLLSRFAIGAGHGLLALGAGEVGRALPPALAYWRDFAARLVAAVCGAAAAEDAGGFVVPAPSSDLLAGLVEAAPPMPGGEYVSARALTALWEETRAAFAEEVARSGTGVEAFLKALHPAWNLVGRVHFSLAENRRDEAAPFAFLATYTTRLSAHGTAQHLPLGRALSEMAGPGSRRRLLSLLLPVQRAAESCPWLRAMVDAGEVFHPLRWTPSDALRLLRDVPALERAGIVVRMPVGWRGGRPPRPQVTATVGTALPSRLGTDAVLDFDVSITLEGEPLTAKERSALLAATDGLALVRGTWVEVDRARLEGALERMERARALAARAGLPFADAMRMLAGAGIGDEGERSSEDGEGDGEGWSRTVCGPGLARVLAGLRSPEALARADPGADLRGTLRPYQAVGVRWLHLLTGLGLGACLADDMGLGKTVQVLALLLVRRRATHVGGRPSLLVAPASLLANWAAEAERFAPSLRTTVLHPSAMPADRLRAATSESLRASDLVVTSYGSLLRLPALEATTWDLVVLDEAQAIKNPAAKQSRAAKRLVAAARVVLTGTPIENRLSDLWSLFDFANPGLLGSARAFTDYTKRLSKASEPGRNAFAPLRALVRPYVLRRLKTDEKVIADLPDKTEVRAYCHLARKQAVLYQQSVDELAARLAEEGVPGAGMRRRGLVLSFLVRLKQICNHPSQWLSDGAYSEADSGKWSRLRELAEVVASRQEKMLVFSQFREVAAPLSAFLGSVFGRAGLVLHGETPVARRRDVVRRFQEEEDVPFLVLSLKAGGVGLNLTAASHVVHFDRWWNPAVEEQATDRAFRIGQTKNVLVHKFVCRGTVEERIDDLIESKRRLSRDVLEGGAEVSFTELPDDELLSLVRLDLSAANGD